MKKTYPRYKRGEIEKIYDALPSSEKKFIEDYIFYRRANGLNSSNKVSDLRRAIIQARDIIEIPFKEFNNLEQLNKLSIIIKESYLKPNTINYILVDLKNLFIYTFDDWSSRFKGLKCFSYNNKDAHKDKDIPTDEEYEAMLKTETSTYYKTFLLYMNSTGLRIIEARETENEKISFNSDGTSTIKIFMTKTSRPKTVFADPQTTDYIKKLQDEQRNIGTYGKYLFQSPSDKTRPIGKDAIDKWFNKLSIKATGKRYTPYSLRHRKATQLYKLAKRNLIAESTALRLMGHNKSMMETYDHTTEDEEVQILKEQTFNMEISPERKHELEIRLDKLEKQVFIMFENQQQLNKILKKKV